ncbi:MAG: ABC transporter permease [Bradymonadia bacterium]
MTLKQAQQSQDDVTFSDIVWLQFKKNRVAYLALWALAFLFILAICAPIIASDRAFYWAEGGETYFPWFTSLFDDNYFENGVDKFFNLLLVLGMPLLAIWLIAVKRIQSFGLSKRIRRAKMKRFAKLLSAFFGLCFIFILANPQGRANQHNYEDYLKATKGSASAVSAVFPPIKHGFARQVLPDKLRDPSMLEVCTDKLKARDGCAGYALGTDSVGRDVLVRMLYGIRIALSVGVIAVGIYVTIGIFIGAFAGYFRGRVDMIIQRVIEIFMAVPTLIVILVLISFIDKPSIFHIMLVIGLFRWTGVARLVRGEFYRLRNLDFVTSAIALGFSTRRIIFQHILPNALGPVLVAATFGVAAAILIESSLSFLGLGDVNVPSWGQTLRDGYLTRKWHLILIPGTAIFITVTLLNLVGEGLRDALDPKMRK